jgi:glycogenin glucosyltransferase
MDCLYTLLQVGAMAESGSLENACASSLVVHLKNAPQQCFPLSRDYHWVYSPMTRAYVTLVVTDNAAAGALVLAHRLRDLHDSRDPGQKLLCLVTSDVSANTHHALATVYEVVQVDTPRSKAALNLHLLGKPNAALSLAKVEIWNLTQYEKILYLDPDVLPLRPIDELFEFEELSAAPDVGWPDWFHTGVFVANPSRSTYAALKSMTEQDKVYEGT